MPTYEVRDLKTGEDTEILCSHASLQEKIDSGRFVQIHKSTANLISHHGSILGKTSDGWKDLNKRIKQGSGRGNSIKT
jgi:hypothetical protein|tara:strand:+ start:457 stop:690 length:234 start_codon:yes stop_codon:yes gene_type:complete